MDLLNPPRLDKQSIRKFSDRAAKSYDNAAILQEEVQNRLIERLAYMRHQPRSIIDVGCGTGKALRGLQKAYPRARVLGVDIAQQMLVCARPRFRLMSKQRLVLADMERLPFCGGAFDLVFSSLALPWCNDLKATLAEFARVSAPGTLLLFSSFGPGTLRELAVSWQQIDDRPHVHRFVDMHDVGDAMMATGQNTKGLTPEKLQKAIAKQEAAIKQKYGCDIVDFKVVVTDGKVKLKAAAG